ncbi:unnamed protein product [Rhizoctonia solani]|uniref:Protein kinase domain-containing protein n=1 Tax=Rhizoctonia solani TaxID=456999 RepID=A0A8H3AQF7_9AGAM|nr:unnamed protein product [Rhizoctonia solani]
MAHDYHSWLEGASTLFVDSQPSVLRGKSLRDLFGMTSREREKNLDGGQGQNHGHIPDPSDQSGWDMYQRIGFVTSTALENWDVVMDICGKVNQTDSEAKKACDALCRDLQFGRPVVQLSAARLWLIMMRHCLKYFVGYTADRKFLEKIEELALSPATSPVVRDRLVEVIGASVYWLKDAKWDPEDDTQRLFGECRIARENSRVLSDLLVYATPESITSSAVIKEAREKCLESKGVIDARIDWVIARANRAREELSLFRPGDIAHKTPEEDLLHAFVVANNELNGVFKAYSELEQMTVDEPQGGDVPAPSKIQLDEDDSPPAYQSLPSSPPPLPSRTRRPLPPRPPYDARPALHNQASRPNSGLELLGSTSQFYSLDSSNVRSDSQSSEVNSHDSAENSTKPAVFETATDRYGVSERSTLQAQHPSDLTFKGNDSTIEHTSPQSQPNSPLFLNTVGTSSTATVDTSVTAYSPSIQVQKPTQMTSTEAPSEIRGVSTPLSSPTNSVDSLISRKMAAQEVVSLLVAHGCQDLSEGLDLASFSEYPLFHGGFSDIYRGQLLSGTRIALKALRVSGDSINRDPKHVKQAAREISTWGRCRHPNVIPLLGLAIFRDRIGMVAPWMGNGSLPLYLRNVPGANRFNMCVQIGEGLSYLHQIRIIHCDLKGANVLVSDEGIPCLTDFGTSLVSDRTLGFTQTTSGPAFTVRWSAAEIIEETSPHTEASDVYALGMTIYETMTGKAPYHGKGETNVMLLVTVKKEFPERPESIPNDGGSGDDLWKLLVRCWSFDPTLRPSADEVTTTMKNIDWNP